jgi:hypothetical protein
MEYKGLPLFNLDIIEGVPGIELISLVDAPAVERDFIKFSKEAEVKMKINEEQRIVTGVALIPGQKIYREDQNGKYYIQFSREAIERAVVKFFEERHSADANLMHEYEADGIVYFESYLINRERGILPVEFADCPDGTWVVSAKILNDNVWELIKQGVLRGFSIEGKLGFQSEISSLEELLDYINNYK